MPGRSTRPLARLAVFFLLVSLTACSRSSPSDPIGDALKSFAGNWTVISADRNGKKSDAAALKGMVVAVEGDKFKFEDLPPNSERAKGDVMTRNVRIEEYILQVNPAKSGSGDVDLIHTLGANQGKSRLGIYELEGDRLKLCYATVGEPRPTEFVATPKTTLLVLERQP